MHHGSRRWKTLPWLALTLVGCGTDRSEVLAGAGGLSSDGGSGGAGAAESGYEQRDASELFESKTLPKFELSLPPERWEHLRQHALDEEYEPAELRFDGALIGQVGLRFKGNIGTLTNCFDAEGNLSCRKLSMKLKLDEYEPDLRFYGLKRLNLHSLIHDASLLHEKLTYDLYREAGVAAPRSSWALATVNGVSLGVFSLVEEVDGRFTKDRWPEDGNGNLYKEAWPLSESSDDYATAIETNEETATHEAFVHFAADLRAAPDAAARREALGRWMDLEQLARYMAVDDLIANFDGATAIYCRTEDPSTCGNHNYFFYLTEDQSHFRLVPWDLDATMWPQTVYNNVPPWQVTPKSCDERYPIGSEDVVLAAPGCDPLFSALAHDLTDYDAAVSSLVEGAFSVGAVEEAIDRHVAFIADAVAAEPGGQSVERWRSEVATLKRNVSLLQARAQARRRGLSATPLDLSPSSVNDFEQLDAAVLSLLPSYGNPSTSTAVTLAGADATRELPLAGRQSLLLSFEYRNEGVVPWGQWTNLALPFQSRPLDLSAQSGVRLTLRTDGPRTVRIDLDSQLYEAGVEGIKFGWEVLADRTPLTVELPLAAATLPSWARPTLDQLVTILTRVDGLAFHPICNARDSQGLLAEGTTDPGFLELDSIELF